MSEFTVTYSAAAVAPGGYIFNASSVTVSAVLSTPPQYVPSTIVFTLQNNVDAANRTAVLQAVLAIPSPATLPVIPDVTPIFMVWPDRTATNPVPSAASPLTLTPVSTAVPTSTLNNGTSSLASSMASTLPPTSSDSAMTSAASSDPAKTASPEPTIKSNTGAVAGAAVGCFFAGLLIASILAFVFYRRRSKRSKRTPKTGESSSMDELHEVSFVNDVGFAKAWDKRLPQPDSDQSIAHLASRTLDEIELFVEEFCNNKPTMLGTLSTTSGLSSFDSPHLDASLDFLLQKATSPTVLIKHCIAFFLLQKIDPSSNVGKSLLPREYIVPNSTATSSYESRQAISQIRVLMANTRSNPNHDQQYVLQRNQIVGEAVRQIEQAFQPWVRGDSSKRSSALNGVIIHLSELGVKLFSQPSTFEWQWGRSNSRSTLAIDPGSNEIVVLPGLDKTTDQRTELLTTPICLVKPRTASWAE